MRFFYFTCSSFQGECHSARNIQEDLANSYAKNTQLELKNLLEKVRVTYNSVFMKNERISACKRLFDKNNLDTLIYLLQKDSKYHDSL